MDYYTVLRQIQEPRLHRYHLVTFAKAHGVKPVARHLQTSPASVRTWLKRADRATVQRCAYPSGAPKHPRIFIALEQKTEVIALERFGAKCINHSFGLSFPERTVRNPNLPFLHPLSVDSPLPSSKHERGRSVIPCAFPRLLHPSAETPSIFADFRSHLAAGAGLIPHGLMPRRHAFPSSGPAWPFTLPRSNMASACASRIGTGRRPHKASLGAALTA